MSNKENKEFVDEINVCVVIMIISSKQCRTLQFDITFH